MISYAQIARVASRLGLPEDTIEKDYFIEIFLSYLARDNYLKDNLVFRGGTALKKIYFEDYRYSEDLNFLVKGELGKIRGGLEEIVSKIGREQPFEIKSRDGLISDGRLQFFILYDLFPEIRAVKELKIDVLEDVYLPPRQKRKIIFTHPDLKKLNLFLSVYDLESVMADKISRILDVVDEPRDLFDFWYLLKLDLNFKEVKRIFKEKHGLEIRIDDVLVEIKKEDYQNNWRTRLSSQVPDLPPFKNFLTELEDLIKEKLR